MKIIGILGSTRKDGNTEILLDLALQEAQEKGSSTSTITLRDKAIAPCDGCMGCSKTGECVIEDDMQEVYEEIRTADGIIWATPVYFWSMSGLTKIALDRTYALCFPKLQQAGKVGGSILVAAGRGCTNAANAFNMYFSYNHMFFTEFAWGFAREKGEIKENKMACETTREMVRQMTSLLQANLKHPDELDLPMPRLIQKKCSV